MRRLQISLIALFVSAALIMFALALIVLPPRLLPSGQINDLAKAQSDIRGNLVAALGVLAVLVGAMVGFLNYREVQDQNRKTLKLQERGQVTERFSKAIEQLGKVGDQLDIRIGGIYALAEIAHDSPDLHWPIMEVITAFLREHTRGIAHEGDSRALADQASGQATSAPVRGSVGADFTAAMTVLSHRDRKLDRGRLDLRRAQLEGLVMDGEDVHLEQVDFSGALLERACFRSARLDGANFGDAHLEDAIFDGAILRKANFVGAVLRRTVFAHAQLEGAKFEVPGRPATPLAASLLHVQFREPPQLEKADFTSAELRGVRFGMARLQGARFDGARLEEANFWDAQLLGASFQRAHLDGADFGGTQTKLANANFVCAQLVDAKFHGVHAQHAWFRSAVSQRVKFNRAHLESAEFTGAQLQNAVFTEAHLQEACFWNSELQLSCFWDAELQKASFSDAWLQGADFTGAKLQGVDFDRAQLNRAIFSTHKDNKIYDAEGLELEQLARAASVEHVVLPSYIQREDLERLRSHE